MATVNANTENAQEGNKSEEEEEGEKSTSANFECNICLDTAKDAVISMCGHLFCWPCLHQWLETRHANQTCPVCKAAISKDKVIPLYGRGSSNHQDPREKLPPRPPGQRTEPEQQHGFLPGFNFGDGEGFQFHFGIGAFPFGIFTSFNNLGFGGGHGAGLNLPPEIERMDREVPRILQYVLLLLAFFFYWNLLFS